jgi:hypothetical protein
MNSTEPRRGGRWWTRTTAREPRARCGRTLRPTRACAWSRSLRHAPTGSPSTSPLTRGSAEQMVKRGDVPRG